MASESRTSASASTELFSFVHGLAYDDCPEAAVEMARTCIVDAVGVMLAGVSEDPSRLVREHVDTFSPRGEATVVGGGTGLSMQHAAMINGVQGHALDYDDVTYYTFGFHPSVTIVPTLLAAGERVGASGEDLLAAFVAAFELEIRLPGGVGGHLQRNGYHTTPVVGSFGSAAAASRLLGLSLDEFRRAAAIAASLYGGLAANFGTMTKPLHAGLANRNGIQAALLAERGFEANADLFDDPTGPWPGFLDDYDLAEWTADLGSHWYTAEGIDVKVYPSCGCTHCAIDAALAIRSRVASADATGGLDSIRAVEVYSTPAAASALRYHDPTTPLEGKFSMEYCVAAALAEGSVGLEHFEPASFAPDRTRRLQAKTAFHAEESMAEGGFVGDGFPARVVVTTDDGQTYEEFVEHPSGSAEKPVSEPALREKFAECASRTLTDEEASAAYERLRSIDELEDVRELLPLLAPSA